MQFITMRMNACMHACMHAIADKAMQAVIIIRYVQITIG